MITIIQDASDGVSIEADLEAAAKALETSDIEFPRYGDTLFEVLFAGGRLGTGASLAEDNKMRLEKNVRLCFVVANFGIASCAVYGVPPSSHPCSCTHSQPAPPSASCPALAPLIADPCLPTGEGRHSAFHKGVWITGQVRAPDLPIACQQLRSALLAWLGDAAHLQAQAILDP